LLSAGGRLADPVDRHPSASPIDDPAGACETAGDTAGRTVRITRRACGSLRSVVTSIGLYDLGFGILFTTRNLYSFPSASLMYAAFFSRANVTDMPTVTSMERFSDRHHVLKLETQIIGSRSQTVAHVGESAPLTAVGVRIPERIRSRAEIDRFSASYSPRRTYPCATAVRRPNDRRRDEKMHRGSHSFETLGAIWPNRVQGHSAYLTHCLARTGYLPTQRDRPLMARSGPGPRCAWAVQQ